MSQSVAQARLVDVVISPFEDHLQLSLHRSLPDLNGLPRNGIQFDMVENGISGTRFIMRVMKDGNVERIQGNGTGYETVVRTTNSIQRDTFEIRISDGRVRMGMPECDLWWIDEAIDLDWNEGVVQWGHHSYNPTKACDHDGSCGEGTWHWDNMEISPATPFTMIKSDRRNISESGGRFNFVEAAPENAKLRFSGYGTNIEASADGGPWVSADLQWHNDIHGANVFRAYFTDIAPGTASIRVRGDSGNSGPLHVRDVSIWANDNVQASPPPRPTVTPTPTPGSEPPASETPTPEPTTLPVPRPTTPAATPKPTTPAPTAKPEATPSVRPTPQAEPTAQADPTPRPDPAFPPACTITGTEGADVLVGTPEDEVIHGQRGRDLMYGGRGNDVTLGGTGRDVLTGGRGVNELDGGPGRDLCITYDGWFTFKRC